MLLLGSSLQTVRFHVLRTLTGSPWTLPALLYSPMFIRHSSAGFGQPRKAPSLQLHRLFGGFQGEGLKDEQNCLPALSSRECDVGEVLLLSNIF